MDSLIQLTLVANAGLLLRYQDTSILLDALFSVDSSSSCQPSCATREKLLRGVPPFDHVDYVLFTHLHKDHFSPELTWEFLRRHTIKGLILPCSGRLELQSFFSDLQEVGIPCAVLTRDTFKTVFHLSSGVRISAFRTLHLGENYHDVLHFCYLIACGEKKLLFTADADYTRERFSFLGAERLHAAFVNPLLFCDLQRRRFFHGTLSADAVVVYHLPLSAEGGESLQRMFSRSLEEWPKDGPPAIVLERELSTITL